MIRVTVNNTEVLASIQRIAGLFSPAGRATENRKIGVELYKFVMRNFETEGRMVESGGWTPLSLRTILNRSRKISGKKERSRVRGVYRKGETIPGTFPILQDDGDLRRSFHQFSDSNEAGVGAKIYTSATKKRKPPADLAKIHQYGSGRIPARPMLPRRDQGLTIALQVYRRAIEQVAGK